MSRISAVIIASTLMLAACATPTTVYAPANNSGIGFQDQKIESNRFSVIFTGDTDASMLEVEKLALRRAAEVTLANNASWFRVVTRSTDLIGGSKNRGTNVGVSAGGSSRGYSGVGVGIGIDLTPTRKAYETRLEILTGSDLKPTTDEDMVYDAKSILESAMVLQPE